MVRWIATVTVVQAGLAVAVLLTLSSQNALAPDNAPAAKPDLAEQPVHLTRRFRLAGQDQAVRQIQSAWQIQSSLAGRPGGVAGRGGGIAASMQFSG